MTDTTAPDCARFDDELNALAGSAGPRSAFARQHLDTCGRCQALYDLMRAEAPSSGYTASAALQLSRMLTQDLAPVRPAGSPAGLAARLAAGAGAVAGGLISLMGRGGLQAMTVSQTVLMTAVLLSALTVLCLSLARYAVPGSRQPCSASWLVGASGVTLFVTLASVFPWPSVGGVSPGDWPCAARELAIGVPLTAACWWVAARGLAIPTASLGAIVAGLSAITAFAVLQGQCPRQVAPHLLLWHLGATVLLTIAGAGAGPYVPLLPRHR